MRIIVHGCTGRMGKMVIEAANANPDCVIAAECADDALHLEDCNAEADVVIDFTSHFATKELLAYCVERKLPVVVCTTGQTEDEMQQIRDASAVIPVFYSANMSMGIAVLKDLAKRAVAMFPEADVEIVEIHHNQKVDVPSGTAILLANEIHKVREDAVDVIGRHENGKRKPNEIGIHSLRMGSETGTHEVYIRTGNELVKLSHQAFSRAVFADGAIKAAFFLAKQNPGLYSMDDM